MGNRKHSEVMDKVVEEAGKCELCGSKRGLEAHHIIPVVCGGDDSEDNLICVCQCCHARLTPRAILVRLGIRKTQHSYSKREFKLELYDKIEEIGKQRGYDLHTVFDAIEEM